VKRIERYKANPEKFRARSREWQKFNAGKKRAYLAAWKKANPEKVRAMVDRGLARKRAINASEKTADQFFATLTAANKIQTLLP